MIKAKKSLGQNFLKSEIALNKIIEAGEIKKTDIILEIGPGRGALTEKLLKSVHPAEAGQGLVVAVEKDRELFAFLKEKFASQIESGYLFLLNEDILEFNVSEVFSSFSNGDVAKQDILRKTSKILHYKIIANIPYNITGAILKKFLTEKHQPECMVLMVQHEVAKRIVAHPRHSGARAKESILSISVKAYGEPKLIMKVAARYFSPAPKVDSAIIKISNISRKNFLNSPLEEYPLGGGGNTSTLSRKRATPQEGNDFEEKFWEIVKAGFAHKRKKLSSNLKNILRYKNYTGLPCVTELGNRRAEDLTLLDWISLAKK